VDRDGVARLGAGRALRTPQRHFVVAARKADDLSARLGLGENAAALCRGGHLGAPPLSRNLAGDAVDVHAPHCHTSNLAPRCLRPMPDRIERVASEPGPSLAPLSLGRRPLSSDERSGSGEPGHVAQRFPRRRFVVRVCHRVLHAEGRASPVP
jgi:hypothetical protein